MHLRFTHECLTLAQGDDKTPPVTDRPLAIKAAIIRHTTRQDAIKALRAAAQQSDDIGGAREALTAAAAALEAPSDIRPNVV